MAQIQVCPPDDPESLRKVDPPLRWDTCPSVLNVDEAAALLRWNESTLRELVTEQSVQYQHGNTPANPLPYIRRGKRITFPSDLLREWTNREARP